MPPERHRFVAHPIRIAPGEGRSFRVEQRKVAVFNLDGEFVAIDDACPHMRADLSCGVLKGRTVTCTWHGWEFDLDTGNCVNVEWARVRRYPVRVEGDDLHVTVEAEPQDDPAEEEDFPEIVWKNE